MTKENIEPTFIDLQLNGHDYEFFGKPVKFAKLLTVRFPNGSEETTKLSYTREFSDGTPTSRPVPCIRIDGEKLFLDEDSGISVAQDCIAFIE
jgi:hypothetical protein